MEKVTILFFAIMLSSITMKAQSIFSPSIKTDSVETIKSLNTFLTEYTLFNTSVSNSGAYEKGLISVNFYGNEDINKMQIILTNKTTESINLYIPAGTTTTAMCGTYNFYTPKRINISINNDPKFVLVNQIGKKAITKGDVLFNNSSCVYGYRTESLNTISSSKSYVPIPDDTLQNYLSFNPDSSTLQKVNGDKNGYILVQRNYDTIGMTSRFIYLDKAFVGEQFTELTINYLESAFDSLTTHDFIIELDNGNKILKSVETPSVKITETGIVGATYSIPTFIKTMPNLSTLSVSTNNLNIAAQANSTATFNINSNIPWTVTSNQSWLTASSASGTGNSTITLTVTANPNTTTRTATITVSGTGVTTQTITVTQDGVTPILTVSTDSISIAATANCTASFNITSNIGWTITSNQTWLTANTTSGSNNAVITLTAQANSMESPRSAIITINGDGVATKTITIIQVAKTSSKPRIAYITFDKTMVSTAAQPAEDPIIKMLQADTCFLIDVLIVSDDAVLNLNNYDVVIVQESFNSTSSILKPSGSLGLANISVPFVYNKTYSLSDGRSFTGGASGSGGQIEGVYKIDVNPINQSHELFKSITFTDNSLQLLKSGANDDGSNLRDKTYNYGDNVVASGGVLLGMITGAPSSATVCLNDFPAGTTIGSETIKARMITVSMNFGAICKDAGTNLTNEGLTVWRNAVYILAGLPVPNTLVIIESPFLSVSTSSLNIGVPANSTATFNITSNIPWTINSNQTWLTTSRTSGSENTTITLSATENPDTISRTGIITVTGTGVSPQTITVSQYPFNKIKKFPVDFETPPTPTITVDQDGVPLTNQVSVIDNPDNKGNASQKVAMFDKPALPWVFVNMNLENEIPVNTISKIKIKVYSEKAGCVYGKFWTIDGKIVAEAWQNATDWNKSMVEANKWTEMVLDFEDVAQYTSTVKISDASISTISFALGVDEDTQYKIYFDDIIIETKSIALIKPNLAPYTPSGWSDAIVVSKISGNYSGDSNFSTNDELFLSFGYVNCGEEDILGKFKLNVYLNETLKCSSSYPWDVLEAGYYMHYDNFALGKLNAGSYTLKLVIDYDSEIDESDETDNVYTKTFTVSNIFPTVMQATIKEAKGSINVDGNSNEQDWAEATKYEILRPFTGETFWDPEDLSGYWKAVYSSSGIYILVDVTADDILGTDNSIGEIWEQDRIEIYFDMNSDKLADGLGANGNSAQCFDGQFKGHYQIAPVRGENSNQLNSCDKGVLRAFTINGTLSTEELFFPWSTIKSENGIEFNPASGKPIGFDVYLIDNDLQTLFPRNRLVWSGDGNNGYEDYYNMDDAGLMYFTDPTGINEPENNKISIFPNPASTKLFVRNLNQNVSIKIYNIQGKLLINKQIVNDQIDISSLTSGVYLVRIFDNDKILTRKLIKQ